MKIYLGVTGKEQEKGDLFVVFAGEEKYKSLFDKTTTALLASMVPASARKDFKSKKGSSLVLYPHFTGSEESAVKRLALVGLGKAAERKSVGQRFEVFRCAGGDAAKICKDKKSGAVSVVVPDLEEIDSVDFVEHFIEGLLLGLYHFDKYKTEKEDDEQEPKYNGPKEVLLLVKKKSSAVVQALSRGEQAAVAGIIARNMANEPGNGWTPAHFAEFGQQLGKRKNVSCTVLEKKDMKNLGMGGLLGVNQGSAESPKLVIVDYCPEEYSKTVMFVGKGLTFDSGGISLKPGANMMEMKYDMCGGAAAIASMEAIIEEQPDVRVVCLVPSTDNMPDSRALKPGDIITHYGGTTSEIENTDAEGRLILADALAYGVAQYTPDYIIDLATLTGAVIIGLGHHYVGALSNDDALCEDVMAAAKRAGEPLWRLPLDKLYAKQLESKVADLKNTGGRPAGTITAAEYLHKFVGETPWVHLDIAGTAWDYTEKSYIPSGPSGIGTRTLIEFVRAKAKNSIK